VSRLSESRISYLARLVIDELRKGQTARFPHEGRALAETKQALNDFFQRDIEIDALVRRKIQSLSRAVPAGSREWDVLYRKYYEEELRKQKR
jgi:hypothetical protein